jgi:hypothetical protein
VGRDPGRAGEGEGEGVSGGFDPTFDLSRLPRQTLASLGREYKLFAFLLTRTGLGYVHLNFGEHEREQIAILEWMGASPVYTQRMQRALNFVGDDMATIYKGLQLDVGFCHQYMDVAYKLIDENHGEFWLKSCGALLDVEPLGETFVLSMCHHIEDPTFDATAVATNPRARIRPIHRPPRHPAGRTPHCHWTVTIDPDNEPVTEIELTQQVGASRLAQVDRRVPAATEAGGLDDYSGEFVPEFQLEDLGQRALMAAVGEFCVQGHLLARSMWLATAERHGVEVARGLAVDMWTGSSWIASERLRALLGLAGDTVDDILRVIQVHPAFIPEYAPLTMASDGERAHLRLDPDASALHEGDGASWVAMLAAGENALLDSVVKGVDARASVEPAGHLEWDVTLDRAAEPAPEPDAVAIGRVGAVAGFSFEARKPLRV